MQINPNGKTQRRSVHIVWMTAVIFLMLSSSLSAQEDLGLQPSGQPGDKRPPLIDEESPKPFPSLELHPRQASGREGPEVFFPATTFIHKINVSGSTVFSEEQLSAITRAYQNRFLSSEDIEALRRELTLLYLDNGYVTSGAVIPDQEVKEGIMTIRIVEGRLAEIDVDGNRYLFDHYYRRRIELGAGPPIKVEDLQRRLVFLQENPRIERIDAYLKPGVRTGESRLELTVEERSPIRLWTGYNNYVADSVGGEQLLATGMILSLTGNGDTFNFTYGEAEGLQPNIDTWYAFPITASDLTLTLRYRKNDFDLVREELKDLNIENDTDIYSASLRYPVYRSSKHELALSFALDHEVQKSRLLDLPFSLEPGAVKGKVKVTPIRFAQDYVYRTQQQVVSAVSQFSLGIDALDATIRSDDLPDGEFFKWQGQLQWVGRLKMLDTQLITRSFFQLTNEPLVSLEQSAVGGRYTVRGYPENLLVRDKAFVCSVESRIPIIQNMPWTDYLQIVPFFDWGWGENKDFPTPHGPNSIYSIGIGLRWGATLLPSTLRLRPEFEIYYGYRLRDVDIDVENSLQDSGISLQVALKAF